MTAHFDENLPGCDCQSNSMIQRASEKTKSRRDKTTRSREHGRVGSQKNIKQNKSKRSGKVLSMIEGIYSGTWYLGEGGGFIKYKGCSSQISEKVKHRSKMTEEVKYGRRKRF